MYLLYLYTYILTILLLYLLYLLYLYTYVLTIQTNYCLFVKCIK